MNRTKPKNYAPQARRDFIQAMTDRAAFYGLTAKKIEPVVERGDVAVIAGRVHPRSVAKRRKHLEDRIQRHGFEQTMEALAYTWFNRLAAIRFMELHGYLDHGYRVLSHREGKPTPEVLEHAEYVELPGLKKETVIDLKLAGNKDGELYRRLLTAQCNALNKAMPFLFEKIDDETELLLPDNLLHSDSLIRKLVSEIDEDDWQEVEIIGWLYQFYISEKKDEVIGKVVASEDIPAATQLFTPNWIVKYLVQNTIGRKWLGTYPQSALRHQMQHYIEPAEQTPGVLEQLKAITLTSQNPEELTLLDPACGSGHILVEAYDLFKAIYQERGYQAKDIPALILQKNLFGLEIDDRAAQLASFALMMKARADDRRIFETEAKPNILAFDESNGLDVTNVANALNAPINKEDVPREYLFEEIDEDKAGLFSKKALAEKGHVSQAYIASLLELFEDAKTFGSLIQVSPKLAATLPEIEQRLNEVLKYGDLTQAPVKVIKPLLQQARYLARQYDVVVTNPPYMGSRYFNSTIKPFVKFNFEAGMGDLCTAFLLRSREFSRAGGLLAMITPPNWMFLPTFEQVRLLLCQSLTIESLTHNGRGVFGADFGSCAFVIRNTPIPDFQGSFRRLFDVASLVLDNEELASQFLKRQSLFCSTRQIGRIPRTPIAYWIDDNFLKVFENGVSFEQLAKPRQGLATGDNDRFLRVWSEVDKSRVGWNCDNRQMAVKSGRKWFPYSKGGPFRRWYGNNYLVVNWENDGEEIRNLYDGLGALRSRPQNLDLFFRPALTWSLTSVSQLGFAARYRPSGCIFDINGMSAFSERAELLLLGFLNSVVAFEALKIINPTFSFQAGDIAKLPVLIPHSKVLIEEKVQECIGISKNDWDSTETSWEFSTFPWLNVGCSVRSVSESYKSWVSMSDAYRRSMLTLEREINTLFIEEYRLPFTSEEAVFDDQITNHVVDREEDIKRLLSYAIGCMMGRYSLDKPGLIYARSGNKGFDPSLYKSFRADDDGIISLLENDWGIRDDAANRIVEFISIAWPKEHLEVNVKFMAEGLGATNGEQPRDTIRRYLSAGFYKHHLSMYKKRPIYWLFSSGKQRAFLCLVYLHRYHEGTLARMRTEYVIPLQGQIAARIEQLEGDKAKATSTSHRRKLQKEQDDLRKRQAELFVFEEKLKHAADQKISLDLDDGVKVNYGKFGDLLAESKAITGGQDDE